MSAADDFIDDMIEHDMWLDMGGYHDMAGGGIGGIVPGIFFASCAAKVRKERFRRFFLTDGKCPERMDGNGTWRGNRPPRSPPRRQHSRQVAPLVGRLPAEGHGAARRAPGGRAGSRLLRHEAARGVRGGAGRRAEAPQDARRTMVKGGGNEWERSGGRRRRRCATR